MQSANSFIRNNKNLKNPNYSEFLTKKEYKERIRETIKCKNDIIYWAEKYYTIITLDSGKQLIKVYPKQKEFIKMMIRENRVINLSARQSGKTTAYNVFALHYACFNNDKNIVITANNGKSASDFVQRIKLAYERLPMFIKPGIVEWNKRRVTFDNGCSITAMPANGSVRGASASILIIDEFGFLNEATDEYAFWKSVYPIVSAGKDSKIICVSTANGINNLFYEIYSRAEMNIDKEYGFKSFRIDWWDVPGRDKEWKRKTIAGLNGGIEEFEQEFGNSFVGTSNTLINMKYIEQFKKQLMKSDKNSTKHYIIDNMEDFVLNIWKTVKSNHAYIIGADTGEGLNADYSTFIILDITDTKNIEDVAYYYCNTISPQHFAYVLCKAGLMYNSACILMENNGISKSAIDTLYNVFEYENLLKYGDKQHRGIKSSNPIKVNACFNMKNLLEMDELNFKFNTNMLIYEMESFVSEKKKRKTTFNARHGKYDDMIICLVWALLVLDKKGKLLDDYYDIKSYFQSDIIKLTLPHRILPYNNQYYLDEIKTRDPDRIYEQIFGNKNINNQNETEEVSNIGFF